MNSHSIAKDKITFLGYFENIKIVLFLSSNPRKKTGKAAQTTDRHLIWLRGGKTISDNGNSGECALSGTAANHLAARNKLRNWPVSESDLLLSVKTNSVLAQEVSHISAYEPLRVGLKEQRLKAPEVSGAKVRKGRLLWVKSKILASQMWWSGSIKCQKT